MQWILRNDFKLNFSLLIDFSIQMLKPLLHNNILIELGAKQTGSLHTKWHANLNFENYTKRWKDTATFA